MDDRVQDVTSKPATAARIYDYYLGGIHNFPADREVARNVIEYFPFVPTAARDNRAFLGRAVRYLLDAGIRQFLDIGSGIPTEGNVHEIVQQFAPEARVVYVDIDPVAVSESLQILEGNEHATAIIGDLCVPQSVLQHPTVQRLIDFRQPVGLLLAAVLHFIQDDAHAYSVIGELLRPLAPGSYLVASHTAAETFVAFIKQNPPPEDVYRRRTATPGTIRSRAEVERFFAGLELVDPGVTAVQDWRPGPGETTDDTSFTGGLWVGVGQKK